METIWLAIIGLAAGVCGGMLGIGGSIVIIPCLTELLGPQQHLFQATAMIVSFFVSVPAAIQHVRAKAVHPAIVGRLVPAAGIAAIGGVMCSELPFFQGARVVNLTALFGTFLLIVAVREFAALARAKRKADHESSGCPGVFSWVGTVLAVALPTGFVSGLLGVGGGVVSVPLQRRFLSVPIRSAIANSAVLIIVLSLVGATVKHIALVRNHPEHSVTDPAELAILLIPTAVAGAWIGGRLTHTLPIRTVRASFAALMIVAGVRMIMRALP